MPEYRSILRTPGIGVLMATAVVARLPGGFATLGTVLLVRASTGSFAIAGAAVAATDIVAMLTAAPLGRLMDRFGQRPVLLPTALIWSLGLAGLATAGALDAGAPLLVALAGLAGIYPPLSSSQRAILATIFAGTRMQAAYALESIIQEAVFICGPLIATTAAAAAGPPAAVYSAAALGGFGTFLFASTRLSREWRAPVVDRPAGGAIHTPAVQLLCAGALLTAVSFGCFEVAATAFTRAEGSPNAAGLFLALWAVGSAAGGLWYGSRSWRLPPGDRIGFIALAGAALFLPAALTPGLWGLAPAAFIAGVAIAPLLGLFYHLVGTLAPAGMVTEAFAWISVVFPAGFAAGAAVAGVVADGPGARVALAISCVGVGTAGLLLLRRRPALALPVPDAPALR